MNSRTLGIIIGAGVVAVIFIASIWSNMTVPSSELENSRFTPVPEVLQEGNDFTATMSGLTQYGNVSTSVSSQDIGRSNPFDRY